MLCCPRRCNAGRVARPGTRAVLRSGVRAGRGPRTGRCRCPRTAPGELEATGRPGPPPRANLLERSGVSERPQEGGKKNGSRLRRDRHGGRALAGAQARLATGGRRIREHHCCTIGWGAAHTCGQVRQVVLGAASLCLLPCTPARNRTPGRIEEGGGE
ncbi:unnamed protein product [Prorocentrum cordatum]|uniref:Uncharacterized protein n=1 Tax=Prorocentrum cordatum TaxID=2364126 RepID=A0ABN9QLQ7_9DINO|nr:unnamed protein product [Polarella glacialis]